MVDMLLQVGDEGSDTTALFPLVTAPEAMVNLLLFGGADWWADNILSSQEVHQSKTGKLLSNMVINSASIQRLDTAIMEDLKPLKERHPDMELKVAVTSLNADDLVINIRLNDYLYTKQITLSQYANS